jgi:predicted PurR-regulated permease PerM
MGTNETPFYQRLAYNLISIGILVAAISLGRSVFVPIFLAILLATLLLPVVRFLKRKGFNDPLSILVPLASFLIIAGCLIFFLSYQVIHFFDDLPEIEQKINRLLSSLQGWLDNKANVTVKNQNEYLHNIIESLKESSSKLIGSTFLTVAGVVTYIILLPIYTFLILYYRTNIREFLILIFKNGSSERVSEVLNEVTDMTQHYILGLCMETALVFTLNTIGFLIIGIKYAVFLGLLAALLNLIPYVGMLIANILSMLITLISTDNPIDVIWVGAVLLVVQLIDNNVGMPMIVGSKVKINALFTIIGVLIGGVLCGVPGMFLAIPGLAAMKVVFDHVPELNPWGKLLSDRAEKNPNKSQHKEGSDN